MKQLSDRSERGAAVLGEMLGDKAAKAAREAVSSGDFGTDLTRLGLDFAFAEVWDRPDLDRRSRSLVVIGMLIALRSTHELKNHFRIGINHGLTAKELEEAVIQSLPYAGFPGSSPAMTALIEVLRELKIDSNSKTVNERGLL
jgi:4-carboxymuconolactone decarboxylase